MICALRTAVFRNTAVRKAQIMRCLSCPNSNPQSWVVPARQSLNRDHSRPGHQETHTQTTRYTPRRSAPRCWLLAPSWHRARRGGRRRPVTKQSSISNPPLVRRGLDTAHTGPHGSLVPPPHITAISSINPRPAAVLLKFQVQAVILSMGARRVEPQLHEALIFPMGPGVVALHIV